ncbi:unnamed protein product, partial [Porites lobata]
KKRYLEKISCVGIDPVLIPDKTYDPECVPPVESMDLLSFLVLDTSYYSKDQFKDYRSLQSYNQLVSGFVSSVKGQKIGNKYIVSGKTKAAALSLIHPFSDAFVSKRRNVPTIADLFDKKYLDFGYHDLLKACEKISPKITDEEVRLIEEDTRSQSKGSSFYRHRAGRIGASISKAACHTNPAQPSQSLIKTICYPNIFTFSTEATNMRSLSHSSPDPNSACFCRLATGGPVVTCTNQACPISAFHLSCLKITKVPSKWFCPLCQK